MVLDKRDEILLLLSLELLGVELLNAEVPVLDFISLLLRELSFFTRFATLPGALAFLSQWFSASLQDFATLPGAMAKLDRITGFGHRTQNQALHTRVLGRP